MANIPLSPALAVAPVQVGDGPEDWGGQELLARRSAADARRSRALAQGVEQAAGMAAGLIKEHVEKKGNAERAADVAAAETEYSAGLATIKQQIDALAAEMPEGFGRQDLMEVIDETFGTLDELEKQIVDGSTDGVPNFRHKDSVEKFRQSAKALKSGMYLDVTGTVLEKYDAETARRLDRKAQDILKNPGPEAETRIAGFEAELLASGIDGHEVEAKIGSLREGVQSQRLANVVDTLKLDIDASDPEALRLWREGKGEAPAWHGVSEMLLEDLQNPEGPYGALGEAARNKAKNEVRRELNRQEKRLQVADVRARKAWEANAWMSLAQDPNMPASELRRLAVPPGRNEPDEGMHAQLMATADSFQNSMLRRARPQPARSAAELRLRDGAAIGFKARMEIGIASARTDEDRRVLHRLLLQGLDRDFVAEGDFQSYVQRISDAGNVVRQGDDVRRKFWLGVSNAMQAIQGSVVGKALLRAMGKGGAEEIEDDELPSVDVMETLALLEAWLAQHPFYTKSEADDFLGDSLVDIRRKASRERMQTQLLIEQLESLEQEGTGEDEE